MQARVFSKLSFKILLPEGYLLCMSTKLKRETKKKLGGPSKNLVGP